MRWVTRRNPALPFILACGAGLAGTAVFTVTVLNGGGAITPEPVGQVRRAWAGDPDPAQH